jgi:hypothetical protein
MSSNHRPVAQISVGSIHAAIWRNENHGTPFYNTTFEARYKDDHGEWKTTKNFGHMEVLALAKCADLAYDTVTRLQDENKGRVG